MVLSCSHSSGEFALILCIASRFGTINLAKFSSTSVKNDLIYAFLLLEFITGVGLVISQYKGPLRSRFIFNKSNKNHRDLQEYIRSLAQLDFVEDIFNIRMTLTNNDLKQATETGIVGTLELPEGGL